MRLAVRSQIEHCIGRCKHCDNHYCMFCADREAVKEGFCSWKCALAAERDEKGTLNGQDVKRA